jgi:hypothetical protein
MLQAHGGDHKSAAYQGSHANLDSIKRGANTEYYLARLKRDHPDIAEALVHGEYPSVRAAAKAAGLVSEPTPLETLHRAWRKVSQEDRLRFLHDTLTQAEWELLQRPQGIPQGAPSTPGGE